MIEFIYALCIKDGKPFYVGRTNEPQRRLREHNYEKKDGTELKYQFIREIESNNIEWEMIILEEVGPDTERFEDFWVYKLIKEGYDLTNQKAGDARSIATETLRSRNFTSAKEFLFELDKEEAEEKARQQNAKLLKKVREPKPTDFDYSRLDQNGGYLFAGDYDQQGIKSFTSSGTKYLYDKRANTSSKRKLP